MAQKKQSAQSGPKQLDLDQAKLEQLLQRVEAGTLQPGDAELIRTLIESLVMLSQAVDAKAATIRKILRLLFGASTEKKDTVLPPKDKPPAEPGKKKKQRSWP